MPDVWIPDKRSSAVRQRWFIGAVYIYVYIWASSPFLYTPVDRLVRRFSASGFAPGCNLAIFYAVPRSCVFPGPDLRNFATWRLNDRFQLLYDMYFNRFKSVSKSVQPKRNIRYTKI